MVIYVLPLIETETTIILLVCYDLFLGTVQKGAESHTNGSRFFMQIVSSVSDSFVNTKPFSVWNDAILTVKPVVMMN
jgi:hypothetical protein